MSAGCIVTLLPGAAQVKVTTNAADISGCTDVGNVAGIGGDIGNIYLRQMQNKPLPWTPIRFFAPAMAALVIAAEDPPQAHGDTNFAHVRLSTRPVVPR